MNFVSKDFSIKSPFHKGWKWKYFSFLSLITLYGFVLKKRWWFLGRTFLSHRLEYKASQIIHPLVAHTCNLTVCFVLFAFFNNITKIMCRHKEQLNVSFLLKFHVITQAFIQDVMIHVKSSINFSRRKTLITQPHKWSRKKEWWMKKVEKSYAMEMKCMLSWVWFCWWLEKFWMKITKPFPPKKQYIFYTQESFHFGTRRKREIS